MDNTGKNMKEILKKVYYLERINYEQGKNDKLFIAALSGIGER